MQEGDLPLCLHMPQNKFVASAVERALCAAVQIGNRDVIAPQRTLERICQPKCARPSYQSRDRSEKSAQHTIVHRRRVRARQSPASPYGAGRNHAHTRRKLIPQRTAGIKQQQCDLEFGIACELTQ